MLSFVSTLSLWSDFSPEDTQEFFTKITQPFLSNEDIQVLIKIVKEGRMDVNANDGITGVTALHYAVISGYIGIVQALLDAKVAVDVQDSLKLTPLHYAVMNNQTAIVQALLAAGASTEILIASTDTEISRSRGRTTLSWASSMGLVEMVRILLDAKAKIDIQDDDEYGKCPLHSAVISDETAIVQMLLAKEANINIQDKQDKTPLHYALNSGRFAMVQVLLLAGAKVDIQDRQGNTPLLGLAVGLTGIEIEVAMKPFLKTIINIMKDVGQFFSDFNYQYGTACKSISGIIEWLLANPIKTDLATAEKRLTRNDIVEWIEMIYSNYQKTSGIIFEHQKYEMRTTLLYRLLLADDEFNKTDTKKRILMPNLNDNEEEPVQENRHGIV